MLSDAVKNDNYPNLVDLILFPSTPLRQGQKTARYCKILTSLLDSIITEFASSRRPSPICPTLTLIYQAFPRPLNNPSSAMVPTAAATTY